MKKIIFTLLFAAAIQSGYSQITYYWVGGAGSGSTATISWTSSTNWNTAPGGGGNPRTTVSADDILIFTGSDISSAAGIQNGPINISFSGTLTCGGLKFEDAVDVTFQRFSTSGGTTSLTVNGTTANPDFLVAAGSKLRLAGTLGTMLVAIENGATGDVFGDIFMVENVYTATTPQYQTRLTAKGVQSLNFRAGSTFNTLAAYNYYPFGSGGSVLPAPYGVVFHPNSVYNYGGGLSPFGGASTTFTVDFRPGSKFYFHAPPAIIVGGTSTNMFTNRSYPDVIVDNNTTVTADGSLFRIDSLRVEAGSTYITHISGSTPVGGHIVNNGTIRVPAADPDRNNRFVLVGNAPQNISGTGIYTLADFIIGNYSNAKLQKAVQVDSVTNVFGKIDATTSAITGPGTITVKPPASFTISGRTVLDSFNITNIADFTGVEIGMAATGAGIQAGTVVTNLSTGNGTLTLSKPMTAAATSQSVTVFNGQGVLPIKFGNISATLINGEVKVNWQILTEDNINHYVVERSADARQFSELGTVRASGRSSYNFTDVAPFNGTGFYRIKVTSNDGEIKYSAVLKVNNANGKGEFAVYPNPVKDGNLNVQLSNLRKGSYTLNLYNNLGQSTFNKAIAFDGGSLNQNIALPASVHAGVYRLTLKGENVTLNQTIVVQ